MEMKQLLNHFIIISCFLNIAIAQESSLTAEKLAELRKNPDTSGTVYITEKDRIGEVQVSDKEQGYETDKITTYEDPENPGVFISEAQAPTKTGRSTSEGISFGQMKGEPMSNKALSLSYKAALYSGIDLDQHALRIAASCEASNTEGSRGGAVINLDDTFYVIPTSIGSLPPLPPTGGNQTIMGIDVNKNCVRDDVEHFIFKSYGSRSQRLLRQHLYTHAIWLRFYLIDGISGHSIQAVARQLLKTGLCLNKIMGIRESKEAQTEIFALMHDTDARTLRYFDNEELLTGFDIDITAPPGC
ncbi:MAG: hypothetical protein ACI9SP_003639 [Arenicella sp.]|jgi:hypothetical protein